MTTNLIINNQQPQPQPPTVVAVQSVQWSTGICDCFDDLQICCYGLWCCPCLTCTTTSNFGECFCLPLFDMITLCPFVSMSMRVAMRYHYKIQGEMGSDCVYAFFCNVCSWCQMAREIKRRRLTLAVLTPQQAYIGAQQMNIQPTVVTSQPIISAIP